ncbi:MAG: hypothetical protein ACYDH3_06475 [Candidatus Aminicenantales bacterium]
MRTTPALLLFHAKVGSRVAIRALAPILAAAFGLFYLLKPELFVMLARRIFAEGDPLGRGMVVAAALFAAAGTTRKSVCFGLGGWIRSLPAGGRAHRRAAVFALSLAQSPITVLLFASMMVGTAGVIQDPVAGAVGLVIASVAAASAVVPAKNRFLRILFGGAAAILAGSGNLAYIGFAGLILVALDYLSGPLRISKAGPGRRHWMFPLGFPALLGVRALGITGWSGFLPAGVVVGATALFLKNNVLSETLRNAAMRAGGTLSIAVFLAFTAGLLVAGRAPWPWSRSWPRTARQRILSDALLLGIPALLLCVPLQWVGWPAVWGAAAYLPAGAARAAGAVNGPRETRSKILGTLQLEGSLAAGVFGLWPQAGFLFLALTPFLIAAAARLEKTLKVTAWDELHHDASGDPGSWSTR